MNDKTKPTNGHGPDEAPASGAAEEAPGGDAGMEALRAEVAALKDQALRYALDIQY